MSENFLFYEVSASITLSSLFTVRCICSPFSFHASNFVLVCIRWSEKVRKKLHNVAKQILPREKKIAQKIAVSLRL